MTSRVLAAVCCLSSFFNLASAQNATPSSAPAQTQAHELTIEDIYAEGGLLGRAPESIKWAPDGSRVAFVQRDDSGEQGALYYVDATTGKPAVLVASEKLASLAPPTSAIKDERKKEAAQRYSVAAYHWSPDSKKLLFDSMGQLWLYSLDNGTAVQITSSNDASCRSQVLARRKPHRLRPQAQPLCPRRQRRPRRRTNQRRRSQPAQRRSRLGLRGRAHTSAAIISGRPTASRSPSCR